MDAQNVSDQPIDPDSQEIMHVERWDFDVPVAAQGGIVYFPVAFLCTMLGISQTSQLRRIKANRTLVKHLRTFRLANQHGGGRQPTQCLSERAVGLWLGTLRVDDTRPELQEWLADYQDHLVDAAYVVLFGGSRLATHLAAQLTHLQQQFSNMEDFVLWLQTRLGRLEDLHPVDDDDHEMLHGGGPEED